MRRFGEELAAAQPELFGWLLRLTAGDRQAAEEVLSRVNLILVTKQEQYDTEKPILPWMRQIAYWQLKAWRSEQGRERLVLDDETLEAIAVAPEKETDWELRLKLLEECRKELTPMMNELLRRYYDCGERLADIGKALKRPPASLANSLCQIRKILRKKITARLKDFG